VTTRWNDSVERWAERHDGLQRIAQEVARAVVDKLRDQIDSLEGPRTVSFHGLVEHRDGVVRHDETKFGALSLDGKRPT